MKNLLLGASNRLTFSPCPHGAGDLKETKVEQFLALSNRSIINTGLSELKMKIDESVAGHIVEYSCGYPHYTHLLAFNSCKFALVNNKISVNNSHLNLAIEESIKESHESLRQGYQNATLATKKNIFKEVLFACSVAQTDENNTFQAIDLEVPLTAILSKQMKVNQFGYHIAKFCSAERGNILIAYGVPKRQRYKFRNPLMRAFVRLNMHPYRR